LVKRCLPDKRTGDKLQGFRFGWAGWRGAVRAEAAVRAVALAFLYFDHDTRGTGTTLTIHVSRVKQRKMNIYISKKNRIRVVYTVANKVTDHVTSGIPYAIGYVWRGA